VRKLLAVFEGTPLDMDMRSVLAKIAESLEGEISVEPEWLGEHVSVLAEDRVQVDPALWAPCTCWPTSGFEILEIFGALREIDYQGAVTMEPFLVPGGEVGRDVSLYRDLLGSADRDELVTRSVQFVRSEQNKIRDS
jgi:hypothetical protein